jgi:hypothetical protein
VKKLIAWVRAQRASLSQAGDDLGPRREFVYLDEVSVYSLLASRLGSIPEQLTKSASESLQSEINSAIGATTVSKLRSVQNSPPLRRAIKQTIIRGGAILSSNSRRGNARWSAPSGHVSRG